ncbi:kinesin-domain-containing protein [Teratosphaeria nubilosa]|uniref:Kinesin-domain-containing protein n=1 Tax=Teratosphaeria nubilosa TaxID=161662 RepID=A0A6G1LFE6_9PEZI|nr:kinesin-domain-containing protein [Teratosphaeria nubilosa]
MRPPAARPGANRAQTATPTLTGRVSPTESVASSRARTPKRKAANEIGELAEETNINVVVRCRGRNDREVRENSGVVVSTEGVKGKKVELSMGPSALSNKTYHFDKVFSPAADQGIVFDEVVTPILDEVLGGFNCTIFAYGQTGTGKTYTMSGDISDMLPIPEAAGIIPRVLHDLFARLGEQESEKCEHSVKCSFIELYNEELRDLLARDDTTKLKIFDEANKNGRTTTLVQGMEESHIKSASKGIQLLREGSHKRQVAATKCNDLSSRSHTVFTITVYVKRATETGEDYVSAGKLNLVDLAGSENIQRSGAENKRAAEAGLINKSLLTLGRVINALVDKSSHIPYRESKLTRLLQDSLGGRTKTCIIATLSPAKSNLEETISTLDYAFRAKNIRNKPQVNQMVSKKTLLKEYTAEIEKLKSELIATRQRNGVYLTSESYEEITTESESRRILAEEQKDRIETMEANLRNKVQELFVLTTNFQSIKKDNERTREVLEGTKSVLDRTEIVLAHTKRSLAEETHLRKAHEQTEEKLAGIGEDLMGALDTTTDHVNRLHSKLRRRSDLQSTNRSKWADSQAHVADTTTAVEQRIEALRDQQQDLLTALSDRMQSFVTDELQEVQSSQAFLHEKSAAFEKSEAEVKAQTGKAKDEMNHVLEEISGLREDVKQKIGSGLNNLSAAAQRISAGIATELDSFHTQLEQSYVSLGKEFKSIFEGLIKKMTEQQAEAEKLRQQMAKANAAFVQAGQTSQQQMQDAVDAERQTAATERESLLAKITGLINESAASQKARLNNYVESANKRVKTSEDEYRVAQQEYGTGMDLWSASSRALIETSIKSRDTVKSKIRSDWTAANDKIGKLTETTHTVHGETVRIVDGQMQQIDNQLVALDDILSRVRAQNDEHHVAHTASLGRLASDVQESYQSIEKHFETSYERTQTLDGDMNERAAAILDTLPVMAVDGDVRQALSLLRSDVQTAQFAEYIATGETPAKTQYSYPTTLPRTEAHENLLERLRGTSKGPQQGRPGSPTKSPSKRSPTKTIRSSSPAKSSPTKTAVFTDTPPVLNLPSSTASAPTTRPQTASSTSSLRELDANVLSASVSGANAYSVSAKAGAAAFAVGAESGENTFPATNKAVLRRQKTDPLASSQIENKLPMKRSAARMTVAGAEGRENLPPPGVELSASVGPGGGRRLRPRGSD